MFSFTAVFLNIGISIKIVLIVILREIRDLKKILIAHCTHGRAKKFVEK